jgi:hypothetical protein
VQRAVEVADGQHLHELAGVLVFQQHVGLPMDRAFSVLSL